MLRIALRFTTRVAVVLASAAIASAQLVVSVGTLGSNAGIWRVDVTTGQRALLFNGGASAIAVDDAGGRVFAADGSQLASWNYGAGPNATVLGTVVKPTGAPLDIQGMAFGGGRLFATTIASSQATAQWLFEIDLTTLVATPLPTTQSLTWIEEMSFDSASGLFYLQHDIGTMYTMDILGGGSPQFVATHGFGPDGGALGANGLYYITYDDGGPIRVFDLTTNSYTGTTYWSPYNAGADAAGADWAPSLLPPTNTRVFCEPSMPNVPNHICTLYAGSPSASAGSGFTITNSPVPTNSRVQPHFSLTGPANAPFLGGLRCVRTPVFRMPQTNGVSGAYTLDFNSYIASGANPGLVAGQTVWFQLATQTQSGAANNTFALSAGLRFTILP